ncbi:unnamed protein product [Mytilus coruscus]|uniref:C-type lectin domain-containing protein n=1 Tax=Mytilus coruscus TaxID=42192 RepID=A0A6J8C3K0_MYTCO|nr:unnamed protein product [Mytilus coruscus]
MCTTEQLKCDRNQSNDFIKTSARSRYGFEKPLSWLEARSKCGTQNKILLPFKAVHPKLEHHYRTNKSVWSSDYILQLGCNDNTGFCPGLSIKQVPQNESYLGLCQHDSSVTVSRTNNSLRVGFKSDYERKCREGSLVDINDMATLHDVIEEMTWNTKYWIYSINLDTESFVLQCMLFTKYPNGTEIKKTMIASACRKKYKFVCTEGDDYGTVISKIKLPNNTDNTPVQLWKINQPGFYPDDGTKFFQISGAVSMVVIVFGLIIIGCLLKRWISKMKKELIETLRQKYEHHMYEVERVEPEPETVPETPVSLGGDSLYENVHTGNELSREANMTVSYMTSREIRRPVTVPISAIETGTQNSIPPRLTLPQRLPSREKAIRRKTGSRQLNTHLKPTRKKQSLPETSQQSQLNSSGNVQKKNAEISKVEASAPLTIHRPKPSPKPHTKDVTLKYKTNTSRIKEGIQIHDISGEFAFYLNTGQSSDIENTDYLEEDQDYENIWQNSNEQSI